MEDLVLQPSEVWISCERAGAMRSPAVSGRRMRQIARDMGWPTKMETTRGGSQTMVRLDDVLGLGQAEAPETAEGLDEIVPGEVGDPEKLKAVVKILNRPDSEWPEMIAQAAEETGKSTRTIRRWLGRFTEAGNLHDGRKGNRNRAKHGTEERKVIATLYRDRSAPTAAQVHKAYRHLRNTQRPELADLSARTVARIIADIPELVKARRGGDPGKNQRKASHHIKRNWTDRRVMETWMGDGTAWNQLVAWEGYQKPIRPWLVVWMDIRSRMIVAWRLVDKVNGSTAMLALRDGISVYGLPDEIWVDNGSEYINKNADGRVAYRGKVEIAFIKGYMERLGIGRVRSIAGNPDGKAPVERFFDTLGNSYLNVFDSYTGGNITSITRKKDDRRLRADLAAGRIPDQHEARELCAKIIRAYNAAPHDGLSGNSPMAVFNMLHGRTANGQDKHPVVSAPETTLNLACLSRRVTTIGAEGVEVMGQFYWSESQEYLMATGKKGVVAWDPDDLSKVYVYVIKGGREHFVCEAPPVDENYSKNEQTLRRQIARQKRQARIVREAADLLTDRKVEPRKVLTEAVLVPADQAAVNDHDNRFQAHANRRADENGPADVVRFPAGGSAGTPPQHHEPSDKPLKGLFGKL